MRTPRPVAQRRGFGTLIGNGWLHESPKNIVPRAWEARGKSALRKCMFMPSPYAALMPAQPAAEHTNLSPMAVRRPRVEEIIAPVRKVDPSRQARVMPAYIPPFPQMHAKQPRVAATAWYEDPIALGSLLILLPPIGLAALWSSKRYSNDARWALTIMTGLTMSLAAAVFVSALVLRMQ